MHAIQPINVRIVGLRRHEQTIRELVEKHKSSMESSGVQIRPITIVHDGFDAIVDGHHRTAALHKLGYKWIRAVPLTLDYYLSGEIRVLDQRNPEREWDKQEVLERALEGRPFKPKTTRHQVRENGEWLRLHDSKISPIVNYPLEKLARN